MKNITSFIFILISINLYSITYFDATKGDENYKNKDFSKAEENYKSAIETSLEENPKLHYNLGNTYFNQKKYDEALDEFGKALASKDKKFKSKVKYNVRTTYFQQQK